MKRKIGKSYREMVSLGNIIDTPNKRKINIDTIYEEIQRTGTGSPLPRKHQTLTINRECITYSPLKDKTNSLNIENCNCGENPYKPTVKNEFWGQFYDIESIGKNIV